MDPKKTSAHSSLSTEQIVKLADQWTPDHWRIEPANLTPDVILAITPSTSPDKDPKQWQEKTRALIEGLTNPIQIEACARAFTSDQIKEIISLAADGINGFKEKLFPFFVGMPNGQFVHLLLQAESKVLILLKEVGMLEPVQHHLTLLAHDLSSLNEAENVAFIRIEQQIANLDLQTIDKPQILEQELAIGSLREKNATLQKLASLALAISWNTNRADLIESISQSKEQSQRFANAAIGHPGSSDSPPSGLYAALIDKLNSVYCIRDGASLSDDEPIMEALAALSVWYLSDYHEIGLLPQIKDTSKLDLCQQAADQNEGDHDKDRLFATVRQNLKQLGLCNLKDLKTNRIFSKQGLKTFIHLAKAGAPDLL